MKSIGIILTPDNRSKAYLTKIIQNKLKMDKIIFLNDNRSEKTYDEQIESEAQKCGFSINVKVKDMLKKNKLEYRQFNVVDINNAKLISYLKTLSIDFFIFTGGGILRKDILNSGPKFIHLHPGIVPEYRGSTCFYYSMINENNCGVTAFIMDEKLDTGEIIHQKIFEKPNHQFIDEVFDAHIRSETLIELLQNKMYEKDSFTKQSPLEGETYHIIHPVLKHIAILSCIN